MKRKDEPKPTDCTVVERDPTRLYYSITYAPPWQGDVADGKAVDIRERPIAFYVGL